MKKGEALIIQTTLKFMKICCLNRIAFRKRISMMTYLLLRRLSSMILNLAASWKLKPKRSIKSNRLRQRGFNQVVVRKSLIKTNVAKKRWSVIHP